MLVKRKRNIKTKFEQVCSNPLTPPPSPASPTSPSPAVALSLTQVFPPAACGTKADIVFMLDSSGSVGSSNFKLLLSFVNSLTKDWDIGQDKIRVGVEKFSSRPFTEFHLSRYNDKQQMLTAINNIKYQSGGTNTGKIMR